MSLTKSENVSLGAHNDMSLCFLICYDEAYKIITILLDELSCQKSQSFEYSSLKKFLKSLESLYWTDNGESLFLVFFDKVFLKLLLFRWRKQLFLQSTQRATGGIILKKAFLRISENL